MSNKAPRRDAIINTKKNEPRELELKWKLYRGSSFNLAGWQRFNIVCGPLQPLCLKLAASGFSMHSFHFWPDYGSYY